MKMFLNVLFALIGIGIMLSIAGCFHNGFLTDNDTYTFVTKTETNPVQGLVLEADNRRLLFHKSENEELTMDYYESEHYVYTYTYTEGVVKLVCDYTGKLNVTFDHLHTLINVYLPKSFNGDISTLTTNGSVELKDQTLADVSIRSTNGAILLSNLVVESLNISTTNGLFDLSGITSPQKISGTTTNGLITVKNVNAPEITLGTSNGSITVTDITSPVQSYHSTNGTLNGSNLTVEDLIMATTNGTVNAQIKGNKNDYRIETGTTIGTIKVNGVATGSGTMNGNAPKTIDIDTTVGSINLNFSSSN
jgi:hypothetical protein